MKPEDIEKKLAKRHLYQTPIGLVCMTKEEHEMYEEAKQETKKMNSDNCTQN